MGHFVFELNLEVQSILVQISFWLLLFQVQTDGHLSIEFTFDEYMRIRSWKFNIKDNMELVPRSSLLDCKTDQTKLEELTTNVTEHGFSKATLQYLRVHVNSSCSFCCQCHKHVLIFTTSYFHIQNKCFPDSAIY